MSVDQQRIKKNLEEISFPRLSGTEHEERAFRLLKDKLNEKGIEYYTQNFTFSTFYSRIYPKVSTALIFWLFLILSFEIPPLSFWIQFIGIAGVLLVLIAVTRKPENIKFGKMLKSQNVIVRIPSQKHKQELKGASNLKKKASLHQEKEKLYNSKTKEIFIFAHLDSKSQRLSIKIRVLAFRLWILSVVSLIIFLILRNLPIALFQSIFSFALFLGLGLNLISVLLILLNTTHNRSLGAIDNASGAVCVLEILNHFAESDSKLENYDISLIFIGAEECGTMGIRHYSKNVKEVNKKHSFIINIDGIGEKPAYFSSYINKSKNVNRYYQFKRIAEEVNLDWNLAKVKFGIRSDGIFMKKQGFHGFGFGDLSVHKYVHSKHDTIEKVNIIALKRVCEFIIRAIYLLDRNKIE
ncbi:MAG: M28 family metallopeptidase [Promethearchaeia archaeon]